MTNASFPAFPALNLPPTDHPVRKRITEEGEPQIFDRQRQKWVKLTPEEWVRQHFVNFLVERLGYPAGRVANEVSIRVGKTSKRCDTVVYNATGKPLMIVEYKATSVQLTPEVFQQVARYNIPLQVDYLVVSNGLHHYVLHLERSPEPKWVFLNEIPHFDTLL